jgi:hypothetical protein
MYTAGLYPYISFQVVRGTDRETLQGLIRENTAGGNEAICS